MTRFRVLPLALALVFGALGACGNDDASPATTGAPSATAVPETAVPETVVPETVVQPSSAAPTVETDLTTRSNETAQPTLTTAIGEGDRPLILVKQAPIASGLVEAWSPNGDNVIVARIDPSLSKEGCEGAPEPVLFLQPVDGERGTVAFPDHPEQNGSFIGAQAGSGDLVTIAGCEGFLGDVVVSKQAPDGTLRDPRVVTPSDPAGLAELTGQSSLSLDGTTLLLTGRTFVDGTERAASNRVDLVSGAVTAIETDGRGGAAIAEATKGRIVVGDGKSVDVLGRDGTVQRSYPGGGFAISPDGGRLAVLAGDTLGIVAVGDEITDPVFLPFSAETPGLWFSPDGRAVAVLAYDDNGAIAIVRGGKVNIVDKGASFGRVVWRADSAAIAYNRFSADFSIEDVIVATELAS